MAKILKREELQYFFNKIRSFFIISPGTGLVGQVLTVGSNGEPTWDNFPSMLEYKGFVQSISNLPSSGNKVGDVWLVLDTSEEYFWKRNSDDTYSWELLGTITYGPATTSQVGVVKPDGTTITVDNDGTIHSAGGGTTYTAGDHITITSNVISAKTSCIDNAEYELDTFYATNTTMGDCRFVFYTSELENYLTITDPDTLQSETCQYIGHLLKMELYNLLDLKWEDLPDPYGIAYRTFYLTTLSNTSKIYIVADTEVEPLFDDLNILTSYTRTGTTSGELCLASDIKALLGIKENLIHAISPIHLERSVADGTLLGLDYDTDTLTKVNNKLSVSTSLLANWNSTSGRSEILNKPTLATVATSGSYNDLIDKPTIPTVPTQVSAFTNDAGYVTSVPNAFSKVKVGTTIIEAPSTAATVEMIAGLNVTITPSTANGSITIEAAGGGGSGTTYSFAEGSVNGTFEVTPIGGTTSNIPVHGVLTAHLTLTSHAQVADTSTAGKVLVSTNSGYEWQNLPSTITSSTVSGWGFTTNVGTVTAVSFNGTDGTLTNGKVDLTATIPASLIQSDWALVTTSAVDYIKNKPTTISGYGITDAKIENGIITLGSNSITPVTTVGNGNLNVKVDNGSVVTVCSFSANATSGSNITFELGSNITLTPNTSTNKITIAATNTTYTAGNNTIAVNNTSHLIQANGYLRPGSEVVEITDPNISYLSSYDVYNDSSSEYNLEIFYSTDATNILTDEKAGQASPRYNIIANAKEGTNVILNLNYLKIDAGSNWEGTKTFHYIFKNRGDIYTTVTLGHYLVEDSNCHAVLDSEIANTSYLGPIITQNEWGSSCLVTLLARDYAEAIITFAKGVSVNNKDGYYTIIRLLYRDYLGSLS